MDMAKPRDAQATKEQLRHIINQYECADDVLKDDLEGLAAIAWLAYHACGSDKPGYMEENYEQYASEAFRFISAYLTDRSESFLRIKNTIVDLELGKTAEGSNDA